MLKLLVGLTLAALAQDGSRPPEGMLTPTGTCAWTTDHTCQQVDVELQEILQRYPDPAPNTHENRHYARQMFVFDLGVKMLEKYRPCLAENGYLTHRAFMSAEFRLGRTGCEMTSADEICSPYIP